jgi:fumarylacetoacetase
MSPDATNNPHRRSWVATANHSGADFPIQNLPIAEFRRRDSSEVFRGGIAIGDQILDLSALAATGAFSGEAALALRAAACSTLNDLMQMGPRSWSAVRHALFEALLEGSALQPMIEACLVPQAVAQYSLPAQIGDFTDFYSSVHHATAVGRLFRPDNPLTPNYKWMPIGYHGRSSSVGISGQDFHRPRGQRMPPGESRPIFAPSVRLDYELELGVFLGNGNSIGSSIPIDGAESHVFGLCLLNDWSARDLQAWEYQPLGPFLSKNFATTISPWIVPLQALAPYRTPHIRAANDPAPPAYLVSAVNEAAGGVDITLEAYIETAAMHSHREPPQRLSSTSFRHSYWTLAQLVAHHTVNGCNLRAGDLLGTGTQSGPGPDEAGSLLELSSGGKHSVRVGSSEHRTFLEDGDTVTFRAWCERPGAARIGFGEVRGRVLPATADPVAATG